MRDTPSENRIISIRTSRVEEFAELSVSDRGPGIPEDKLKGDFRAVLHQQGGRHGHGVVHCANHYRGAQWADMGKKSGSRRCVVPDQASHIRQWRWTVVVAHRALRPGFTEHAIKANCRR